MVALLSALCFEQITSSYDNLALTLSLLHLLSSFCVAPLVLSVFLALFFFSFKAGSLDLGFWSFLIFLHHGIEKVEGNLVFKIA